MNTKILFGGFVLILLFNSCKTMKSTGTATMYLATKKIIKEHYKSDFSKKTIEARIKTHYKDSKQSQNVSIKLRIQKDEVIWMSGSFLGFPIAKVKITPTRVQYYEKIKRTFFDGDFSLISNALGTELNFQQLQNLLVGQSLLGLDEKFVKSVDDGSYLLTPKKQAALFAVLYWINPINFKLDKQQLSSKKATQTLLIEYPKYLNVSDESFPQIITITAKQPKQTIQINMEFRSVEFDKNLRFPFKIPSGYKKISIPAL